MLLLTKSEGYYQYAVAEFDNPLVSVVPVEWIFQENAKLFCNWTSSSQHVILLELPNLNWPVWPTVRILARRDKNSNCSAAN